VLAGLTGVALAPAQAPPRDGGRHLVVVPDTAEGQAALARTDARVVARYESFSLVEAAGGDEDRLLRAGAERRDDMRTVKTAAGEIDPRNKRRSLAGKAAPDREETLALVQFVGPPKDPWLERVRETGAQIVTYQAQNAYIVHARGEAVERLAELVGSYPVVRAVSVLTAADKLEGKASQAGTWAVTTVAGGAGEEARDAAAAVGSTVGAASMVGAMRTQYLALSADEAAELARASAVVAIEPYAEPELADERASQIVAGNLEADFTPSGPGYLDWLVNPDRVPTEDTFDFVIDVTDTGLDNGIDPPAHADFRELGSGSSPDRVAYNVDYTTDSDASDCGGHGTNVASIVAGYADREAAADGEGFKHGVGIAPFARIGASKIFPNCGGSFVAPSYQTITGSAYAAGARISNNSWGTGGHGGWGEYTAATAAYDALVRDAQPSEPGNQEMVEVFAAGNDGDDSTGSFNEGYGTILAEATAKNVITVGASEGVRTSGTDGCGTPDTDADSARDIVGFSSRGPTDDGRLKPDLVAPGTHITGAAAQHPGYSGNSTCNPSFAGSPFYSLMSGSSQAAPQVSGAAALVRKWYEQTQGSPPSPALTKALLLNAAVDLADGQNGKDTTIAAGPNTDQGWGRVNVGNVFDTGARVFRDQLPADVLTVSGESRVRAYSVQDTGRPVKVTLAWTDAPGPTSGNPSVNDLDLVVEAGGQTYKGNVFAGAYSRTGGAADPRNNVESVYLPAGTSGSFAVKVVGTNIPGDGVPGNTDSTDQDFGLVVSNAGELASPVLVHEATTLDDSPAAGGDGDGALEPNESFELDESIRNAGDEGATGVSGTLAGTAPLTITQNSSSWPDLGAGTSGGNSPPFEGQLAGSATCGADVTATLTLTTTQGPHAVPITIPTGTEGAPETPLSQPQDYLIPDDYAAGVTSTIQVPNAPRIKDLDVRIGRITHGWVGDLRIEITAPDRTTVTLADHPGGPDNGGDNFIDTVFDDEAPSSISVGDAPYTGRFRPQSDQLARFDGKEPAGTWTVRVRDLFEGDTGTLQEWGIERTPAMCSVDSTPPKTSIDSGPDEGSTVASTQATFDFSSTPAGAGFECQLDGAPFEDCSSPKTYGEPADGDTALSDGTHTFRVRSVAGGKVDPTPATRTWTVDTSAPNTRITSASGGLVNSPNASFQFVSPDTPDAAFECRRDGQLWSACSDPYEQTYGGLPEGEHTFEVRARDAAGSEDLTPATCTWTVDTRTPEPALTIGSPFNEQETTDVTPAVSGSASTAPGDSSTVTLKVYEGRSACGPPIRTLSTTRNGGGAWSLNVTPPLPVGEFTVQAEQSGPTGRAGSPLVTFEVFPDSDAPDTVITSGPSGATAARDAAFTFESDEPGSDYECSVDGAAFASCSSPHALVGLPEGSHTLSVRARDVAGNLDATAATRSWTVDVTPPGLAVTAPAAGATVTDTRPMLLGSAGAAFGDAGAVTVNLWSGTLAAGLPAQTLIVPRDHASGAWSAQPAALAEGTWTVRAEQSDSAGNIGVSAPSTFSVDIPNPAPVAPSFVVGPGEERLADALAGRLTVLAACASACEVSAKLTVSARAARRLGVIGGSRSSGARTAAGTRVAARAVSLGSGVKRLASAGIASVRVRLSARARAALRDNRAAKAALRVRVKTGGETLAFTRTISLRRSIGLRQIASHGLRLWAACSVRCPLAGRLTVSRATARRVGLKVRGPGRVEIASGVVTAGEAPARLTVRVRRGARKALRRARRVPALLEAVAGKAPSPQRVAKRKLTLRR
jgi:subtilisin-like proprotein convertase family protein